jgi:signal transduction histidine kinase
MAIHTQSVSCFAQDYPEKFVEIFEGLSDPVAIHEVVCDPWGAVTDSKLCWWNDAFSATRVHPIDHGLSIMNTYENPHVVLAHLAKAWTTGESLEFFHVGEDTKNRYLHPGAEVDNFVRWKRIGDHIIEWSCGTDEMLALRNFVKDQESLVAIASRKRALAIERERMARNLHDVVIQNLYAASLSLSVAGRRHDDVVQAEFDKAVAAIDQVIAGIRNEILNVESHRVSQLRLHLEDCLLPLIDHAQSDFELLIEVPTLPNDVEAHVRAVCIEATSNAVRHGTASFVRIRLTRFNNQLLLTIADNGSGISPESQLQNGLRNMRERALALGGNMVIETQPETGTIISWSIPYPRWQS